MKTTQNPVRTTIFFGLFFGLSFIPLSLYSRLFYPMAQSVLDDPLSIHSGLWIFSEPPEQKIAITNLSVPSVSLNRSLF